MTRVSLDGRVFRDATPLPTGDVGTETRFEYHEDSNGTVWAHYGGGDIRAGYLVGTRDADTLTFRYVHLTASGETASGQCVSTVEQLADGRLRLHESWQWESKQGDGVSVIEEVRV